MLLKVDALTLRFGGLTALSNVSLEVRAGQIFSIIGPNGAGKTSFYNVLSGVYPASSGSILLEGEEASAKLMPRDLGRFAAISLSSGIGLVVTFNIESLWNNAITNNYIYQQPFVWSKAFTGIVQTFAAASPSLIFLPLVLGALLGLWGSFLLWKRARRSPEKLAAMGMTRTFQNIRLFKEMTVLDNILVGMHLQLQTRFWGAALRLPGYRREGLATRARAREILQFVGLEEFADARSANLSYGHQRRLEIGRALATNPKLLLLDEPAAGMNPAESNELTDLIRRIRDRGITVMLIEHHMKVVMEISDRIAVLDYGVKIAEGTPQEIMQNPKVIEAYLGKGDAA